MFSAGNRHCLLSAASHNIHLLLGRALNWKRVGETGRGGMKEEGREKGNFSPRDSEFGGEVKFRDD